MEHNAESNPTTITSSSSSSYSSSSFGCVMELSKSGAASVPSSYILPPTYRPNLGIINDPAPFLAPIDMSLFRQTHRHPQLLEEIRLASKELGFFQVINHGIPMPVMSDALDVATEFFNLPHEEKLTLASGDVHEPKYIDEDIEKGSQALAVNCYPRCPQPDLVLGIPPHSDYGYLTIILQNQQGLEIMDHNKRWCQIPVQKGALVIQIGDQLEIMSNGQYRSPIHRATVNKESNRISIASLHSLALDRRVAPALELVNEQNPPLYRQGSFNEFLDFISKNDVMERRYLDTLKINNEDSPPSTS